MALAQIIDLDERRRARNVQPTPTVSMPVAPPMWCYVWMPVYVWYVA